MTTDSSRAGFEFAARFIFAQNDRALFASATAALAELARIDADQPPATAAARLTSLIPTVSSLIPMVSIPAGSFLMGSPANELGRSVIEGPQHEVTLAAFWMAQTPITQAQWREVASWQKQGRDLDPDPSHFKGENRPVERVSWLDAIEFCNRLSQRTGKNYTLPSEAQWEYTCRAGTTTPFHFGPTINTEAANYDGNYTYGQGERGTYREQTTDVASFPANPWGLYDMHGNVWEWCRDEWHDSYEGAPADGSATAWGSLQTAAAWRVVDQLPRVLPFGLPPLHPPGHTHQLHRFPRLLPLTPPMPDGCCAAGRGATAPGTVARLTATSTARTSAASTSVSASVASPRTNSLPFYPLTFTLDC